MLPTTCVNHYLWYNTNNMALTLPNWISTPTKWVSTPSKWILTHPKWVSIPPKNRGVETTRKVLRPHKPGLGGHCGAWVQCTPAHVTCGQLTDTSEAVSECLPEVKMSAGGSSVPGVWSGTFVPAVGSQRRDRPFHKGSNCAGRLRKIAARCVSGTRIQHTSVPRSTDNKCHWASAANPEANIIHELFRAHD